MTVVVVSGMAFEARIAAGKGATPIWRKNENSFERALVRMIAKGCRGLISFGVAGGLAPHLPSGTCIVASTIVDQRNEFHTDASWSQSLLEKVPNAIGGRIAGVPAPVTHPEAKHALHERTGALAVDMESHIVARVAAAHGLPVAAIRVITDSAARELPKSALAAMRANGTIDLVAMIRSLARAPKEVPLLLRTACDAIVCTAVLRRSRRKAGKSFGIPVEIGRVASRSRYGPQEDKNLVRR